MEIKLNFDILETLKLSAEDIATIKEDIQYQIDEVLENTYGLINEYNQIEADHWNCGCDVAITLKKLKDADTDESPSIDISFCDDHDADSIESDKKEVAELQDIINEEAHKLWLADENAKFNYKYRKLFEAAGL